MKAFFDQSGATWPVVVGDTGSTALNFGVTAVPESYIVSPDGQVVAKFENVTAAELDSVIARYASAPPRPRPARRPRPRERRLPGHRAGACPTRVPRHLGPVAGHGARAGRGPRRRHHPDAGGRRPTPSGSTSIGKTIKLPRSAAASRSPTRTRPSPRRSASTSPSGSRPARPTTRSARALADSYGERHPADPGGHRRHQHRVDPAGRGAGRGHRRAGRRVPAVAARAPTSTPPPPTASWSVGPWPGTPTAAPSDAGGRRRSRDGQRAMSRPPPARGTRARAERLGGAPVAESTRPRRRRRRRQDASARSRDRPRPPALGRSPRSTPAEPAVVERELTPDELAALEEQREFLLTSLRDLEAEHDVGDVDENDYEQLQGRLHGPGRGGHPGHRQPPPAGRGARPADVVEPAPAGARRGRGGGAPGRRAGGPIGRPAQRRRHHHRRRPPEHPRRPAGGPPEVRQRRLRRRHQDLRLGPRRRPGQPRGPHLPRLDVPAEGPPRDLGRPGAVAQVGHRRPQGRARRRARPTAPRSPSWPCSTATSAARPQALDHAGPGAGRRRAVVHGRHRRHVPPEDAGRRSTAARRACAARPRPTRPTRSDGPGSAPGSGRSAVSRSW